MKSLAIPQQLELRAAVHPKRLLMVGPTSTPSIVVSELSVKVASCSAGEMDQILLLVLDAQTVP